MSKTKITEKHMEAYAVMHDIGGWRTIGEWEKLPFRVFGGWIHTLWKHGYVEIRQRDNDPWERREYRAARPVFSSRLMCKFQALRVLREDIVAIDLPEGNFCNMRGAIEVVRSIVPSVEKILVHSGPTGDADVTYELRDGQWEAFDHRSTAQCPLTVQ